MAMFKKLSTRAHRKALKKSEKNKKKEVSRQKRKTLAEKKKIKRLSIVAVLAAIILVLSFVIVKDNHSVKAKYYTVSNSQIPKEFDGYKILQISDLKGANFGDDQERLAEKVCKCEYDMILLTGDYLGKGGIEDFYKVSDLLEKIRGDKPVYYILGDMDCGEGEALDEGNYCFMPSDDNEIANALNNLGCIPVYPIAEIEKDGASIYFTGIKYYEKAFDKVNFDSDSCFSICVTHAPINYNVTKRLSNVNVLSQKEVDFDVSISGHTLGGTVRLPIFGAVYTKEGGAFPEEAYVCGKHSLGNGRISIISAGLGKDEGKVRVFNTPEFSIIELKASK